METVRPSLTRQEGLVPGRRFYRTFRCPEKQTGDLVRHPSSHSAVYPQCRRLGCLVVSVNCDYELFYFYGKVLWIGLSWKKFKYLFVCSLDSNSPPLIPTSPLLSFPIIEKQFFNHPAILQYLKFTQFFPSGSPVYHLSEESDQIRRCAGDEECIL